MSTNKNISLFVPHVFPNFTHKYVADAFADLGDVDYVDFVAKQDRDGKSYNAAYVHFKSWFDTGFSTKTQYDITTKGSIKYFHDESEYYWIVLPNTAKKHVPGERKPRIDLGESKSVSVKAVEKTPEKPVKEVVCPGAPKKPTYTQIADKTKVDTTPVAVKTDDVKPIASESVAAKLEAEFEEWYENLNSHVDLPDDEIQMAEIEAELDAEDANLVSIDCRYVQAIEHENVWLHGEIAQLRMALINLDQMYQAEAAKVRAIA